MTLHQLRIFLAVAQAATLTRASKQLGLAQPSLSKQLASLEESVGTRLFDRGQDPEREDWASWQMPTGANPYIDPAEIESARLRNDSK